MNIDTLTAVLGSAPPAPNAAPRFTLADTTLGGRKILAGDAVVPGILGASAERYAEFELQIRAEYWWVPTGMYRRQRAAVLKSFVQRSSIYATHEFREQYERQARNNIAWGLEQLNFGLATFRWTARF